MKAAQDDASDVLASARQQAAILEQHLQVGRLGSWKNLTRTRHVCPAQHHLLVFGHLRMSILDQHLQEQLSMQGQGGRCSFT